MCIDLASFVPYFKGEETGMTPKQREALNVIDKFQEKFGYTPSVRELQHAIGLKSTSGVHRLLKGLEARGAIRKLPHRARAIEIVKNPSFPKNLSHISLFELAEEAKRRGCVLGHIVTEYHHQQGDSEPVAVRKFKEIQPEEG
jgi:SOS-response transcriptional repressor LexA